MNTILIGIALIIVGLLVVATHDSDFADVPIALLGLGVTISGATCLIVGIVGIFV